MRKWFVCLTLACGVAMAVAQAASAQVQVQVQVQQGQAQPAIQIAIAPEDAVALRVAVPYRGFAGARLGQADAIVVGRVVAFEPMDVQASPAPGQAKANYRIAVVQVSDPIFGVKKGTQTIRVGFIAPANNGPNGAPNAVPGAPPQVQILPAQPAIQPLPGGGFRGRPFIGGQVNLQIGQDGLFTLAKHHKENFYLAPAYNAFVTRLNNPAFDTEVKTAKQLAKVIGNPVAALKADDKDQRYLAAAVLISKYRTPNNPTGQPMKQEPIDAEESKLILKALGEGNWADTRYNAAIPSPFELFNQLGITQRDGYQPVNVRTQQDIAQAMQKWLDQNGGKYRVNKLVVDPNAKQPQPGIIQPGIDPAVPPVIRPGLIRPGIRPLPVKIQPGKVQILPVPAPEPVPVPPVQVERQQLPPAPPVQDLPARRQ